MSLPEISVVVPVFNRRRWLREAIASLLAERIDRCEIIVVDDGSTDGSAETVGDLPVRVVRLSENRGCAAAMNVGIAAASGAYVTFFDSDDLLVENGLRWRLDWMRAHPKFGAVGGRPAGIIDASGHPRHELLHVLHPHYVPPAELTLEYFRRGGFYPVVPALYLYRRTLFDEVGRFDETLRYSADCDLVFRFLARRPISIVFEPVHLRRIHLLNTSVVDVSGALALAPSAIAECEMIYARHGIPVTTWKPWEHGSPSL